MMTLANIPQDIRNEFIVDKEGKVFAKSIRAIARLAGVDKTNLYKRSGTNETGLLVRLRDGQDVPKSLEMFTGCDFTAGGSFQIY